MKKKEIEKNKIKPYIKQKVFSLIGPISFNSNYKTNPKPKSYSNITDEDYHTFLYQYIKINIMGFISVPAIISFLYLYVFLHLPKKE